MKDTKIPDKNTLQTTLQEAWDTHSEFQKNYLNGVHDEMWAGWYAGFVIGRLGEFTTASKLTRLLEVVDAKTDWTALAAEHVVQALG